MINEETLYNLIIAELDTIKEKYKNPYYQGLTATQIRMYETLAKELYEDASIADENNWSACMRSLETLLDAICILNM